MIENSITPYLIPPSSQPRTDFETSKLHTLIFLPYHRHPLLSTDRLHFFATLGIWVGPSGALGLWDISFSIDKYYRF
ncbi:hypothetical protein Cob_v008146 [Colletotrichum orbiculare MAFF 240422]|uniref:Uncharacterized protein n=1 Tax=Colletotrichum orbiculare (strain 104-T / ATCC 96160 / CBS 514.97 / LARS 414 / MAFF 240422) TaxID=1213857 RepID=A0A484FLY1_COLOR|nr:hypothetical protein Cob_v008146 [Colletotrichum orbiculare MAFF 240422]